ncbi:glycosyltransferase family 39 protein [Candidatus Saccharibacteria bacterium]|nr:glycosyltransferase family 39 protein [Candidatus Saccharibacteria bacterium]
MDFSRRLKQLANQLLAVISSRRFLYFTFGWFILSATVIAATTRFGLPPDETYHYNFIQLFAGNGWLPGLADQDGYYLLGEAVKTPFFLYHYLLSLPTHLFNLTGYDIYLLRLVNVVFGILTLLVVYKIARLLKLSKFVTNLSLFMLANTLMFVFINSAINYDSLFNLLSLTAIWLLMKSLAKPSWLISLSLAASLLAGLLVKKNFIVVAAAVALVLIFKLVPDWRSKLKLKMPQLSWRLGSLAALVAVLAVLVGQHYGGNLASYKSYEPRCDQVLALEQCRQSRLFVRQEQLDNMARPAATKGAVEYSVDWLGLMGERTYGVFGHSSFRPNSIIFILIELILTVGAAAVIRAYHRRAGPINLLLVIGLAYLAALIFENHLRYEKYGSFSFAVQGRYALVSLALFYLVMVYYFSQAVRNKVALALSATAVIVVLFISSLPAYVIQTNADWRNRLTNRLIDKIR